MMVGQPCAFAKYPLGLQLHMRGELRQMSSEVTSGVASLLEEVLFMVAGSHFDKNP